MSFVYFNRNYFPLLSFQLIIFYQLIQMCVGNIKIIIYVIIIHTTLMSFLPLSRKSELNVFQLRREAGGGGRRDISLLELCPTQRHDRQILSRFSEFI
jgi:hypothetical protein